MENSDLGKLRKALRGLTPFLAIALTSEFAASTVLGQTADSIDLSFKYSSGVVGTGVPNAVALSPVNGTVVVVGSFTNYHDIPAPNIARLTVNGEIDPTFLVGNGPKPIASGTTNAEPPQLRVVAVDTNGLTYVAGSFADWSGTGRSNVVRLTATGSIDTNFNPTSVLGAPITEIVPISAGKLLVTSETGGFIPARHTGITRLNEDGSIDSTFADASLASVAGLDGTDVGVVRVVAQLDGNLLLILSGTKDGIKVHSIARIHADGTPDTTFHPALTLAGAGFLDGVAPLADGRIMVCGSVINYAGSPVNHLFRLNPDGTLDRSYTTLVPVTEIFWIVPQSDGRIVASGVNWNHGSANPLPVAIVRLNGDGTLDPTFSIPSNQFLSLTQRWYGSITPPIENDGRLIIAGTAGADSPLRVFSSVFRLLPNGPGDGLLHLSAPKWQGNQLFFTFQTGYVLQSAPAANSKVWTTLGTNSPIFVNVLGSNYFFRLLQP
jgi:uncharacterized delta-60 repeat protein